MKKILILFFTAMAPFIALAQYETTKIISKAYDVSGHGKLSINSYYGDIHIDTWDKPRVEVHIEIKVVKRTEKASKDMLKNISVAIEDDSNENLRFSTHIDGNMNMKSNEKMKITYTVRAPQSINFKIDNSYGNFYISDNSGGNEFTISYGSIKVEKCTGKTGIKLNYGNGEIDNIAQGELKINYSNLDISGLGSSTISNNYSNINAEDGKQVTIENRYGNFKLKETDVLYGGSKYGNVSLKKLYKVLDFDGGIKVGWISKDFERIRINAKYEAIELNFEKGFGAKLQADMTYCKVKFGGVPFDYTRLSEKSNASYYEGLIGNKTQVGNRTVSITSAYANAKLNYAE